jgi:hypothetical protein
MAQTRLFAVTYWLLNAAIILFGICGCLLVIGLGGVFGLMIGGIADHFHVPAVIDGVGRGQILLIVGVALAGALAWLVLAMLALRTIARVVETARSGDPFVVENATRLTRLGWLLLSIYGTGIAIALTVTALLPPSLRDGTHHQHFNIQVARPDFSPVGLLAILLIFVLARIFRHGSEMRAELEGTV